MSKQILLEFEKIKDLHSGLGQYCFHLGKELLNLPSPFELKFFMPKERFGIFGPEQSYLSSAKYKRVTNWFVPRADIWHWVHQDSPYTPPKKAKVLLTIHDLNFLFKGHRDPRLKLRLLQKKINRADRIVFISEFTKKLCLEKLKIDEGKCQVIYNGISLTYRRHFHAGAIEKKRPYPYLFTIGIISHKKNFHVLIPMMQELKKLNPQMKLLIAGRKDSPYAHEMEQEIHRLKLTDDVLLIGNISEDEKLSLYEGCSGFVFPSMQEGFGMPVIEAMSLAKPVFVSTYTSLPEIAGPEAYYFHDFSAASMAKEIHLGLNDFSANPEKKKRLRQWTEKFSWEKAARDYLEIYESLAK